MAGHTIQASPEGIQTIRKTLKRKKQSQTYLAGAAGCSRQTIWSLLKGNPIDGEFFMEICSQLSLNWEEIAQAELAEEVQEFGNNLDALVREVREKIKPRTIEQCGTMQVLDMTESIGLNDIYTSVNILEKITGRRGIEINKLMQGFDPEKENFDRVGFGRISETQVPGLEAVKRYSKLMVLGKPGAGKTTFLKYLALQCIGGDFLRDRVPAFITLKDFAETDSQPGLIEFIIQKFAESGVTETQTVELLKQGMAFLLLDGLDEVREEDASRVIKQVENFSERYSMNHVAITCRIAAREHTFQRFKEVEVADFNDEQIKIFVSKWFQAKKLSLVEQFMKELEEHEPIRELATNPLLLTYYVWNLKIQVIFQMIVQSYTKGQPILY
ncbi:NACHT domain-containing protein [Microcoleus sp. FACHB-672]|uniref:NACHT domain-containing protein n=1 Tax=Microcoleus sp. FACHB-672 TaxID=2692825 RepID=UPI0018F00D5E|nr:NACHT domain-containing protein [Microcoleus sp. FACHB-672]